jgi:hypothetical protein
MNRAREPMLTWEEAEAVLGVPAEADEAALRRAYLEKVRQHPPDQDPEAFERIRDAYEQLRNPRWRARQVLVGGPDPLAPLASLMDGVKPTRRFVGLKPWLDALREKERRS